MKRLFYTGFLSVIMSSVLAFSGCEAGLESGSSSEGSSGSSDGGFSFSDLYSDIDTLQEDLSSLGTSVTAQEEIIYNLNSSQTTSVGSLSDTVDQNEIDITDLQAKDTALDGNISTLQAKDTALDGNISTLQAKDTALDGNISTLQAKDTALDGNISTLQTKDTAIDSDISDITNDIQSINDNKNLFTGLVGIGTVSPQRSLHLSGENSEFLIEDTRSGFDAEYRRFNIFLDPLFQTTNFRALNSAGTDGKVMMTLNNESGHVGVGTTNPERTLHVSGEAAEFMLEATRADFDAEYSRFNIYLDPGNKTFFRALNSAGTDGTMLMTLDNEHGSVGIGTVSPYDVQKCKLAVENYDGCVARFIGEKYSDTDFDTRIQIQDITGGTAWFMSANNDGDFAIHQGSVGDRLTVSSTGVVYANQYALYSDVRFKKDITPLSGSLQKLMSLQGVRYNWRTHEFKDRGFSTKRDIGFIAQDVEKLFPEMVHTTKDGYKTVSYSKMTAVLVEAVKEMKQENDRLKKEITSLQTMNKRIIALERMAKKNSAKGAYAVR
ncbi:MAG: hypothetical protein GY754_02185 [bacterium]|nr:hypothetical protein [bacterium]